MKIIAYGSLMNQTSLERTLDRPARLSRTVVSGYERIFNAPFGDYGFLNLRQNMNASIEAAYFELEAGELDKFAEREKGSSLIEVTPGYFAFIWDRPVDGLPVLKSYIDVCLVGARQLTISFWPGMVKPALILDDRNDPIYFI
jgi:hypothetical protein